MNQFIDHLAQAGAETIQPTDKVLFVGPREICNLSSKIFADRVKTTSLDNFVIFDFLQVKEHEAQIKDHRPAVLVICSDEGKDEILSALNTIDWDELPRYVIAGTKHQIKTATLSSEIADALPIRSYAIGYPGVREHMLDILSSIKNRGAEGWIAEFGVFEGGTLLYLNELVKKLSFTNTKLVGFDTFDTFPKPGKLLDQFNMDEFTCNHGEETLRILNEKGIETVKGNIKDTYTWIKDRPLLLTFMDTDNYSPARAALPLCWENTVSGGAVIFDPYFTEEKYLDTIGERVAAFEFFRNRDDFINLSYTGVFIKIGQ